MPETTTPQLATQVFRIVIRATPEQLWDAIARPEFTARSSRGVADLDHARPPDVDRPGRQRRGRHGGRGVRPAAPAGARLAVALRPGPGGRAGEPRQPGHQLRG